MVVDRPKGSIHPRFPGAEYPLDYGFLEGTTSGDGAGVDVWLGTDVDRNLTGVLLSADLSKRDAEIKLLLGCIGRDIEQIVDFMRSENTGSLAITRCTYANVSE